MHVYLCVCQWKCIKVYHGVHVCVLQRRVTEAGCAGVTRPPRSDAGVHIEDGMRVYVWEVLTASRPRVLSSASEPTPALNLIVVETVMLPLSLLMFLYVTLIFSRPRLVTVRPNLCRPTNELKGKHVQRNIQNALFYSVHWSDALWWMWCSWFLT